MRKWTKGFLIFGVVTTVIGFILLFVGIQSDGIKSLLSMSKEPVYDSRTEKLTFGKEVENLEITLHQHTLTIKTLSMIKSTFLTIHLFLLTMILSPIRTIEL
ncbi:Uncharacterised protein [Streptococcus pneumoniae]|nr:Uncharacterised protein [Streptococcus pneumoniae]